MQISDKHKFFFCGMYDIHFMCVLQAVVGNEAVFEKARTQLRYRKNKK